MDDELLKTAKEIANCSPSRIIISNKRKKEQQYEKISICKKLIKNEIMFQAEQFTKTQVFHKNIKENEISDYIADKLKKDFRQADAFSDDFTINVKISKKEKIMYSKKQIKNTYDKLRNNSCRACAPPKSIPFIAAPHNRKKKRLIEEGTVVEPLVDMGIFTQEGRVVKSMHDKFKQINRFLEIVDDAVNSCGLKELTVVDFGCGKAYLTFILYYYFTYIKNIKVTMIGLDLKSDVIEKCNKAALKYNYKNLHFEVGDINQYTADFPIDMVITLHACDTATDYALYNAVEWGTRIILSVPCCQHELNSQIKSDELSILTKYGIIKERFAALATDALRASLLEYSGYKTQVLEFVDLSHTPKNLLIRAVKTNVSNQKREKSLNEVKSLIYDFNADPTLYRLLMEDNK